MLHWLLNEGNKGLLDHMAEEGIDLRKHAVEFRTYEIGVRGGVRFNVNAETSLEGLYAAGDECGGGIAFASIWGRIAGEQAADFSKEADLRDSSKEKDGIDEKVALIEDILSEMDWSAFYDADRGLLFGGYNMEHGRLDRGWHIGDYAGDGRMASIWQLKQDPGLIEREPPKDMLPGRTRAMTRTT